MRETRGFMPEYLKEGQKIIIYGAGRYGEIALYGLQQWGLQPIFFVDSALAGTDFFGIKVIAPDQLTQYKNDAVLIASYNYFGEMLSILQSLGCQYYYDISALMELEYDKQILSEYALEEKESPYKYLSAVNTGKGGTIIPHCEVVLTERCTLKCRDCSNLMQYYQRPNHVDIEELIITFRRFLDAVDALVELRLLGGEPFLCDDIGRVIDSFLNYEKIKSLSIYTNSTIIPNDRVLARLQNKKISVHLSDYGVVSTKVAQLKELFENKHICYYVHQYDKWSDLGGIEKRSYSREERDAVYRVCGTAKCHTFYRGKLYVCPRAAHGERLGIFQNLPQEVVDFTSGETTEKEKRREIQAWMARKESIVACDYCNGLNRDNLILDAGVQLPR